MLQNSTKQQDKGAGSILLFGGCFIYTQNWAN